MAVFGTVITSGGLWHTWFDRDLSIAGRVLVKETNGSFGHHLCKIDKPILRIPTLAIHLDRAVNDSFTFNKETHLTPILAESIKKELNAPVVPAVDGVNHHPILLKLISDNLGVKAEQIEDFEMCLYDTQPASIGGASEEFIHSARLDNLMMSFCSLHALIEANESLSTDAQIRVVSLFDNEEVGSTSAHGADSNLLEVTLRRLSNLDFGYIVEVRTQFSLRNPSSSLSYKSHTALPSHIS